MSYASGTNQHLIVSILQCITKKWVLTQNHVV